MSSSTTSTAHTPGTPVASTSAGVPAEPAPASAPIMRLEAISKSYPGGTQALLDIDLAVEAGEILCLLGPSGCGKTTLLRVVAGLERPDQGRVRFADRDLVNVPVHRRGFGFMFQDFALFPHRTVAENVAFGLRMAGISNAEQATRVESMLELVNLPGYGARTIFELSGGERQRVALARSLAPEPALIMLDEPLGSLDRGLREELVEELRQILKELGVTALYVTHDQDEAMALGDRLVIMQRGRIEQVGTPTAVYTHPATPFVARFLGFTNLIPAKRNQQDGNAVDTPLGPFPLSAPPEPADLTLLLRPEAARVATDTGTSTATTPGFHPIAAVPEGTTNEDIATEVKDNKIVRLQGRLQATTYHGSTYRIEISIAPTSPTSSSQTTPYRLVFQLPAYQRGEYDDILHPIRLPPVGEAIHLLIYADLAALLPYPTSSA